MNDAEQTATAIRESQQNNRLRFAMDRLFYKLKRYVRVYGRTPDDRMPDHDIAWETHIDHGPETAILNAIKMHPELWAEAVPSECCIVHRETLKKYIGADAAEYLAHHGVAAVAAQAARLLHETDETERRERYRSAE